MALKKIKKGTKGTSINYMTRNAALEKLQVSLGEFRKLCIVKGIFPREPKKKLKGNKTYYFAKDINFLQHDPLINLMRAQEAIKKKITKAESKNEKDIAEKLRQSLPKLTLTHILKERYPTFIDALRDMDDALCLMYLFSTFPNFKTRWNAYDTKRALGVERMLKEFEAYVVKTKSLRKTFVSIKGIYYQAEIFGQTITWLVPHLFSNNVPETDDIDMNVMLNFMDFYETLVAFVLFKLYHSLGLHYPPVLEESKDTTVLDQLLNQIEKAKPKEFELIQIKEEPEENTSAEHQDHPTDSRIATLDSRKLIELDAKEGSDQLAEPKEEHDSLSLLDKEFQKQQEFITEEDKFKNIFAGKRFFLSRETPRHSLEFIIRSFGGTVSWDGPDAPYPESDDDITYHIIDKNFQKHLFLSRVYLQPQWIFDCVNEKLLLPTGEYGPNKPLPPHLSPFVDDEREGYIPQQRAKLEQIKRAIQTGDSLATDNFDEFEKLNQDKKAVDEEEGSGEDEEDQEELPETETGLRESQYARELRAEMEGKSYDENVSKKSEEQAKKLKKKLEENAKIQKKKEEDEAAKLMSRKDRNTYSYLQKQTERKKEKNVGLEIKRKMIEEEKNDGKSKKKQKK